MANTTSIQILRSYGSSAPSSLLDGQLAYSFASNTLYIGSNSNDIIPIGGVTPLSTVQYAFNAANSAANFANVAFTQANVALAAAYSSAPYAYANAAYAQANIVFNYANTINAIATASYTAQNITAVFANAAFAAANNVTPQLQPAFNTANAAFNEANLAYSQASFAFAAANAAGSSSTVTAAFITANSAFTTANLAWATANSASNSAYPTAAFAQANASYNAQNTTAAFANSAGTFANAAFARANSAYATANIGNTFVNTGGTITGPVTIAANLTITGNLSVLGNLTSINTTQTETTEPLIFLANNNTVADAVDIGFVGNYNAGTTSFTGLFRNPVLKEFIFFQNYQSPIGSNSIINISDPTFAYANVYASYFKGNVVSHGQDLFYYSNSAFNQANLAYSWANAAYNFANSGASANAAYAQANLAYNQANSAFANANSAILYQTAVSNSVNSIAVGGAPVQNAQTWSTFTVSQVFDAILFPTLGPTYTVPTIGLTGTASGTYEVGTAISQSLTLTGIKNDAGPFVTLYIQRNGANIAACTSPVATATSNISSQYGYSDPNNQNYYYTLSNTDSVTATTGTFTWTGYGNYNAGVAKLTNKGTTDANSFALRSTIYPQSAGTNFTSSSYSVTGIYPYFWGVSSVLPTASSIAAAIQAGTANKVLAVGSGTLTITYNASSQYIWLAVQSSYANKTTWYNTALNNGSIGAGQFILSPVTQAVNSPSSLWSGVNYNVYISGYATTTSGSIQFS